MLEVSGIDVGYGDLQVLWGVSLEVAEGETVALVGANGAGKTTTLKAISGLLRPRRGGIRFAGEDLTTLPPYEMIRRGLVHVPEGRRLFPEMTVEENLIMGSLAPGPRAHRRSNLERVYSLFPRLAERRKQAASTLSGGEQQMLAIARGIMAEPRLLMLDEPSLGLAPILVQELYRQLRTIREQNVTVLLVEQNVRLALELADRAYVLENGRVTRSGPAAELARDEEIRRAYLGI
jgi:branched-chain amino acid transport system ATP-binding protein